MLDAINLNLSNQPSMTKFTSYIIYRKEWALKWAIALLITLLLAFISGTYLKSKPLSLFFFGIMIASFIFIKFLMNYFIRKATIQLDTNKISFHIFKLKDEVEEAFLDYSLFDIKSYNIKFPTNRFACLTLNLNSGNKK
jgi:uncharacterized protein YacL